MKGIGRFARIHDPEGNAIELWNLPREIRTYAGDNLLGMSAEV